MYKIARRFHSLLCVCCVAAMLMASRAAAAGKMEITAPEYLPLGAETLLTLDGGTRSLHGAQQVTVSDYLDEMGGAPALLVGGVPLEADGETVIPLDFEKGTASLPVVGTGVGSFALTLTCEGRTGSVCLEVVSALELAVELAPKEVTVSVDKAATDLTVRATAAERIEQAIAASGFTAAGGKVRVSGSESRGFTVTLTGEGEQVKLSTRVDVYRREAKGEKALEELMERLLSSDFSFVREDEVTAEAIEEEISAMVGDEKTAVSVEWSEEEGCWRLALERQGQRVETPLYLNSQVDLSFDSPALLRRCGIRLAGADDVYVAGGELNVVGTAGNTYEAVVLPIWNYGRNFCIQSQVRLSGGVSDTRWCGLAFGARAVEGGRDKYAFWQLALRWDPTASNGLECARMLPSGAWSTQCAASLPAPEGAGQVYELTVIYRDGVVCQYVDGTLVLRAEVADPSTVDGRVAFTFDGVTAEFLSLKVTDVLPDWPMKQAMVENGYDTEVYEPKTGLVMSPTVVAEQSAGAAETASGERRPATLVRTVNSDLTVTDRGAQIPLAVYLQRLDKRILAGFRIEDLATAAAFAQYVGASGMVDVTVFSSQSSVLQTACAGRPGVRGVLDCSVRSPADPEEAAGWAGQAGARVVVLALADARPEAVRAIQARGVAVWVKSGGGEEAYTAILSGADGIVTGDWEGVMDAIESFSIDRRVLTRTPVITAHRGLHQTAPENTERSAALAVAAGADAIECDVYLSADGVVMVNHDPTTGGLMNQNLAIAQSTCAQLQSLTFRADALPGDRMPTLAQLFQAAEGAGGGAELIFLVEIKSGDPAIIAPLIQTVRDCGMEDRVIFLSYSQEQLLRMRASMPEAAVGYLTPCTQSSADLATNLKAMAECLDPISAFYSCPQEAQNADLARAARHRGIFIHPWTVNEYELFEQRYYDGCHGITTDRADYATYYLAEAQALQSEYTLQAGEGKGGILRVVRQYRGGTETLAAEQLLQIGGDTAAELDAEGRVTARSSGTAVVLLGTGATLPASQVPYIMYTQPVVLTFTE